MTPRALLFAACALAAAIVPSFAQDLAPQEPAGPVLRANVIVQSDLVRVGDFIDNAGSAAQIAIFRAPDLGTTGLVPTSRILAALRQHQVIGVDDRGISEVSVTRAARTLSQKDLAAEVARALERRDGLGDADNLTIAFDRDMRVLQLDSSNRGPLQLATARFDARNGRFDVTFEIANDASATPTKLRFTGTAVETVEVGIPLRGMDRGEILKSSDVALERRPKAEVGTDAVTRERAVGMQLRRAVRAGQPLRTADIGKPDLVQRDQVVSIVYEMPGIYLTMRGKAIDSGAEGDTVSILNVQSKRTVQGVVIGPGQVSIAPVVPRMTATAALADPSPAPAASAAPRTE